MEEKELKRKEDHREQTPADRPPTLRPGGGVNRSQVRTLSMSSTASQLSLENGDVAVTARSLERGNVTGYVGTSDTPGQAAVRMGP